ncbi:MAG: cupin-like domain-containing protein [Cyanobacteriota bacterium]|nr:cupin-like domain-containing protein [Cyanobacteriota bacterium]
MGKKQKSKLLIKSEGKTLTQAKSSTGFQPIPRASTDSTQPQHIESGISATLQRKIAESKLAQMSDEEIITSLFFHGIPVEQAMQAVDEVGHHPYFLASQNFWQLHQKLLSFLAIQEKLRSLSTQKTTLDRVDGLTPQEFLESYYATNKPVILTKQIQDWQALTKWDPDYLKSLCGSIPVEVQIDRQNNPNYERQKTMQELPFGDYLDRILAAGETNDLYMIANNQNFLRDGLEILLHDIQLPPYLDQKSLRNSVHLWLGAAGTITPLHHDPLNILFTQIWGSKHIRLIPPTCTPWLYNYQGVFSSVDGFQPDFETHPLFQQVVPYDVIIHPGEALFIPVGWWHCVRSLEVSLSLSFTNFIFPNQFDWQHPQIRP